MGLRKHLASVSLLTLLSSAPVVVLSVVVLSVVVLSVVVLVGCGATEAAETMPGLTATAEAEVDKIMAARLAARTEVPG